MIKEKVKSQINANDIIKLFEIKDNIPLLDFNLLNINRTKMLG